MDSNIDESITKIYENRIWQTFKRFGRRQANIKLKEVKTSFFAIAFFEK